MAAQAWNPSTQELVAGGMEGQGLFDTKTNNKQKKTFKILFM